MKKSRDSLGDRMKLFEERDGGIFMPKLPVVIRVDGRGFSRWTKGLRRPYDARLSRLMIETTRFLVKETSALIGYTQSDEISLVLMASSHDQELWFGSKKQKATSISAALTTMFFNRLLPDLIPEKVREKRGHEPVCSSLCDVEEGELPGVCDCSAWKQDAKDLSPHFDSRSYNISDLEEAANYLLWREMDATRNSVTMAARHYYSHNEVHKKNNAEKMDMLMAKGVNWNNYRSFFKRGTYIRPKKSEGERTQYPSLDINPLRSYLHEERVRILFGD